MCELATILTIGSTVLGAAGAVQQGMAAQQSAKYNAQVADMNAQLSDRRAKDALERGKLDEQKSRQKAAQIKGQQVAAMAANGVDLNFGSPLDTLVDTAVMGELDALTIRSNTYRESYDYQVDATNKRASAALSRAQGKNALTAGYLNAGGTLLTGGAKAYQNYQTSKIGSIGGGTGTGGNY